MTTVAQNNHCVTEGSNAIDPNFANYGTLTNTNNLAMSHATSTSDDYTSSQTYAYSPTSGSSPTVSAGVNLTSSWPSGFSPTSTGYGCTYNNASSPVGVACPADTETARPTSAAWDVGAYQYSSAASAPNPPTGLTGVVQ
jgi:hypothetical protein